MKSSIIFLKFIGCELDWSARKNERWSEELTCYHKEKSVQIICLGPNIAIDLTTNINNFKV